MCWRKSFILGAFLLTVTLGVDVGEECFDAGSSGKNPLESNGNQTSRSLGLDERHKTFMSWFNSQRIGSASHNVGLQTFDGMGLGVVAETDITEGDEVLRLPLSRVFCRETLADNLGLDVHGFNSSEISDANLIALALVLERGRRKQETSEWYDYLQVLPSEALAVPFTFNEEELNATQSGYIVERGMQRRLELLEDHESVIEPMLHLLAADMDVFDLVFVRNFSSYAWAISLIDSRALTIHGRKYLVPFADMFNFKPHNLLRQAEAGAFFLKHHILTKDSFTVLADRPTSKGQQVFEDYGDTPNHVYFEYHAFVPELNPFDCLQLRLNISDFRSLAHDKLDLIRTIKLPTTSNVCLSVGDIERAMAQHPLFYMYRIIAFTSEEVAFCAEVLRATKDVMTGVRKCMQQVPRLTERLKDEALRHMKHVYSDLLSTTMEEDEALLAAGTSERMANIIKFRMSQKKLLLDVTQYFATGALPPVAVYRDGMLFRGFGNVAKGRKCGFDAEPTMELERKLSRFNDWFSNHSGADLKVKATASKSYRVGVVATTPMDEGEVYLGVSGTLVMGSKTITKSAIWPVMQDIEFSLRKRDPFHSLLVFLMHEYFVEGAVSFWWPYLSLLPQPSELETPLYYTDSQLSRLKAHPVFNKVTDIKKNVFEVFKKVKSFIFDRYGSDFFPAEAYTLENYLWARTILDSRSIWWDGERHLVPMLDFVNCKAGENVTRVHSTRENNSGEAITFADRSFLNGSEVFEDYGQPNHIYYLYHGFTLARNHHDCLALVLNSKEHCVYEPISSSRNKDLLQATSKAKLAAAIQQQYADLPKRTRTTEATPSESADTNAAESFLNEEARLARRILVQLNPSLALESLFPTED